MSIALAGCLRSGPLASPAFQLSEKNWINEPMAPLWQALYEHGLDVILTGVSTTKSGVPR